jgi:hypothetical protein
MTKNYESKKCEKCGKLHETHSKYGNPYKWCPVCRRLAYIEAVLESKGVKLK